MNKTSDVGLENRNWAGSSWRFLSSGSTGAWSIGFGTMLWMTLQLNCQLGTGLFTVSDDVGLSDHVFVLGVL